MATSVFDGKESNPASITPVVLGIVESFESRKVMTGQFGETGAAWATVFGVTIGDLNQKVRGRRWWHGSGNWRPGKRSHPMPLGVGVWLVVRSPEFASTIDGIRDQAISGGVVQDRFDPQAVSDFTHEYIEIGEVSGADFIDYLSQRFEVSDD